MLLSEISYFEINKFLRSIFFPLLFNESQGFQLGVFKSRPDVFESIKFDEPHSVFRSIRCITACRNCI